MHRKIGCLASAIIAVCVTAAAAADPLTAPIASPFADRAWTLTDIDGTAHRPWTTDDVRAVVLVFISTDCPIANYYHPTIRGLQKEYDAGVQWYFVHVAPLLTVTRAREHARAYSLNAPVMFDPLHELARAAGAVKTPQAAVITRDGVVAYLGRIDDTYAGYGKKRPRPTTRDLADALTAVLAGRPVANPRTDSVGCYIPFARNEE